MSKTQELQNYTYFGISHKGNVRENNEDRFAKVDCVNGSAFVLCDGMGGVKGGDIAAQIAIESIETFISEEWEENPQQLIKDAIDHANNEIFNFFNKKNKTIRPGTTLTMVLVRNNKVYYAHVGDSRIYYKTGKKLFPITSDHSHVMDLVKKNIITEDEAKNHPKKNIITKALGTKTYVEPTICTEPISPADCDSIILCSDGLTNDVADTEILNTLLKNKKPKKIGELLLNKALNNGGSDNITVQIVSFYNTGKTSNKKYKPKAEKHAKHYKKFFFIGLIFLLIPIFFFLVFKKNNYFKEIKNIKQYKKTKLLICTKSEKDTIINIFLNNTQNLQTLLTSYNLTTDKIGHASSITKKYGFVKYYVPVKTIYKHKAGKYIYSYPEISNKNIIDVLIVNNKQELFFKQGENIIVP